ncbi:hypothetical protein BASA62_000667 [Batrachochytrium salamandrivorans]|nr:hypothetical protein BASA62_000667 [Batrachochytrium salamandrivorans]
MPQLSSSQTYPDDIDFLDDLNEHDGDVGLTMEHLHVHSHGETILAGLPHSSDAPKSPAQSREHVSKVSMKNQEPIDKSHRQSTTLKLPTSNPRGRKGVPDPLPSAPVIPENIIKYCHATQPLEDKTPRTALGANQKDYDGSHPPLPSRYQDLIQHRAPAQRVVDSDTSISGNSASSFDLPGNVKIAPSSTESPTNQQFRSKLAGSNQDPFHVNLSGKGLHSVKGMPEVTAGPKRLTLDNNEITFLSDIPTHTEVLHISNNLLSNLTSFSHLTALRVLDISRNGLRDISDASFNMISNIKALLALPYLSILRLRHNQIEALDFQFLAFDRMHLLDVSYNNIRRVKYLHRLINLQDLNLGENAISKAIIL